MIKYRIPVLLGIALLFTLAFKLNANAQEAPVRRIVAETSDGVIFSAWVNSGKMKIESGDDIVINFRVENRSPTHIYLVRDNTSKAVINRDSIVLPRPFVPVSGHEPFNYDFTRVSRGKSYTGRIVISKKAYKVAQAWQIDVGFGYAANIKGLTAILKPGEDPRPLKALLSSRLNSLLLCGLRVEVSE